MEHAVKRDGGATVVSFEGDIDVESSPEARRVLLDCVGRGGRVLVVLERVTYIDSSGVASLVEAFQRARRSNVDFALVSVGAGALRVLQLARLDKVFTIHETLADAL